MEPKFQIVSFKQILVWETRENDNVIKIFHCILTFTFSLPCVSSNKRKSFSNTFSSFGLDFPIWTNLDQLCSNFLGDSSVTDLGSLIVTVFTSQLHRPYTCWKFVKLQLNIFEGQLQVHKRWWDVGKDYNFEILHVIDNKNKVITQNKTSGFKFWFFNFMILYKDESYKFIPCNSFADLFTKKFMAL